MEEQAITKKAKADHSSLNLKELFFKYIRFLPLYIVFVALSLVGAYVYLRYATEFYQSSGQLLIRDERNASSVRSELEEAMQSNNQKNIQAEIEVLQSRPLMERAVDRLGLNFNYYSIGKIKEIDIYKTASFRIEPIKLIDSSRQFVLNLDFPTQESCSVNGANPVSFNKVFQNQYGSFKILRVTSGSIFPKCKVVYNPTPIQANMLLGGLAVSPKQAPGILMIALETTSPYLSADIINALMLEYQEMTIEEKNASTQKSLEFIDINLKEKAAEIDSITSQLVSYQKANNIIDPSTQASNYLARIEEASLQERQQRIQLNNAQQLQDYLRTTKDSPVPSVLGIEDPSLNSFIAAYNAAQLERKALLENAQPGHIIVRQKDEELDELRGKILENIKNIRSSYNKTLSAFQSSSGEAVAHIKTLPTKTQDLLSIQNKLEGKMKLYNELLAKRDLSAVTLASTISNTKVMQEAIPNATPVRPNRRSAQVLAVFIGLLIPTIIIVILELLNDKVNSRHDIERLTDATILGEVGHSQNSKTLVVTTGNRKVIAEQFRILRSNLQYVLTKSPKPVIMITSTFSGEGKSFISTNIGAVMALANKRTIILEFDIRKPKIVSGLGMSKQSGLTNYIIGQATLDELPIPVEGYEKLFVLPCGPIPPNPAELLLDTKLDELFIYLRENFDVVIMDTAPVGMVSDALTLSKYADCTLYIVRQGHTYKKQLAVVDEHNRNGKLPKVSIVLNDVKTKVGYGSYGYGSTYGYGYGSGYFDDEPENRTALQKWFGWLGSKNSTVQKRKKKKV